MCVRFFIDKESRELLRCREFAGISPLADRFRHKLGREILTDGEIGPASVTPAIATRRDGETAVFPMQWGFSMQKDKKGPLLLNARTETADVKPTLREAWRAHRCIVPASYYFEWEHFSDENGKVRTGRRFSISPEGENETCLCGLYRLEEGLPHFVILTAQASDSVSAIHDRMPLILPKSRTEEWIDPKSDPKDLLRYALTEMKAE